MKKRLKKPCVCVGLGGKKARAPDAVPWRIDHLPAAGGFQECWGGPSVRVGGSGHAPSVGRSREGLTFTRHVWVSRGFPHLTLTTDHKVSILTSVLQKRKLRLRKSHPLAWGCTQGPGECGSLAPVSPLSLFSGSYGASQAPFSRNLTAQRQ